MSYLGRIEIRAVKGEDESGILAVVERRRRGPFHGDWIATDDRTTLMDHILDLLRGKPCGVWDITGEYHEDWTQDYWGEWDGDFRVEKVRMRYRARSLA